MHIKKLEISGFKSFVDRTVIHFDHDVIGIVGPNGCGKSNVVDALRWCMGEQSAKHLRGRSMEDVIFSGSESRPAHGMAEVILTFDNGDAEYASSLPEEYRDYPEIAVARRLYRDGTSEYAINGVQVRLRDVTELFLGTGVGTKAYSIVEQGRIGQIVSARPQDRRLFIEEAAGVTKYRQRRRQAERKLDLTRQNLLRVSDIVAEIDRGRASLKRQAAKAERFVRYREEVEELMLHQASHRLLELIVVRQCESGSRSALAARAEQLRQSVEQRDAQLTTTRTQASQVEADTDEAARLAFESDNRVASLRAELARGRDRLTHLAERLESSTRLGGELSGRVGRLADEELGLTGRLSELEGQEKSLADEARTQTERLTALLDSERATVAEAHRLRRAVNDAAARIAGEEARLQAIEERRERSGVRHSALCEQREALSGRIEAMRGRRQELEPAVAAALTSKQASESREAAAREQLRVLTPELAARASAQSDARRQLESCQSRLQALEELERRMEGVRSGARVALSSQDANVLGLFADRLEVPAELTDAVAGLLGDRLEAVVASDAAAALPLVRRIREEKKGRVAIVAERPNYVAGGARSRGALPAEALGRMVDLVGHQPEDEPLVAMLFGDAVVVRDEQRAVEISQRLGCRVVALSGTVAEPSGTLVGGSVAAPQIDRKRELSELRQRQVALRATAETTAAAHRELETRLQKVRSELSELGKLTHRLDLAHLEASKDLDQARRELETAERRARELEDEVKALELSREADEKEQSACRQSLEQNTAQRSSLAGSLEESEAEAERSKRRAAEHGAVVTEQKIRLAKTTEQREAVAGSLGRVRETLQSTRREAAELSKAAHEAATSYGETAADLVRFQRERGVAEATAKQHQERVEEVRAALEGIRASLGSSEEQLRVERAELSDVDGGLSEQDMKLQKLEIEHDHLLAGVRERFRGLDLARVVGDYHARPAPDEVHRRRIDELTKLIDRMGPVNLDAKAEYEDAERRFDELSGQQQDIEAALVDLETAIKHMDRESKRRLRETFKAVNELFSQTFKRMFKGGHAQLSLTDPDNLLESGVDIVAQPPGKKLGTVELMSGGEKALTAASLIFAIFQHRPSPFCVLDEVDAPLDEANVGRYNEAIRAMTDKSQFIVITHIKSTMQSVDLLYGVTMAEPGVSRVVSVKVNERARPRAEAFGARPPRSTIAPAPAAADESTQVA